MLNNVREVALAPVCLVLSSLFSPVAGVLDFGKRKLDVEIRVKPINISEAKHS